MTYKRVSQEPDQDERNDNGRPEIAHGFKDVLTKIPVEKSVGSQKVRLIADKGKSRGKKGDGRDGFCRAGEHKRTCPHDN